jgi:uncharacterized protein
MSDASVTPEPSMDEILQKIQRIIAEDEKPESAPAPTPPRSAEILTLTEAVASAPEPPPHPPGERLISDAAATAFAQLAAIQRDRRRAEEFPMGLQARTLEDLVRELLRPMLQGWLDQKMPDIIERLVKAELARALNEAGVH